MRNFIDISIFFIIFVNTISFAVNYDYIEDVDYVYTNPETEYMAIINDEAEVLGKINFEAEENTDDLIQEMISLTQYGNIVFYSTDQKHYYTTKELADNYYYKMFGETDGTLFLIDMYNRYLYVHSDGRNLKYVTHRKAEIIADNVYNLASKSEYYKASKEVFFEVGQLLQGKKIAESMKIYSNLLISLILSFYITFIYVLQKTKIKIPNVKSILKNYNKTFEPGTFSKKYLRTEKEYSPVNTYSDYSSGGSSSGGSSSGGSSHSAGHSSHSAGHSSHSSGGGGGHKF